MFDVNQVSQRIRDARIHKNMTQSNLADEMGVSYQAVSNWERGNSLPDIAKYGDLCRILDVSLEYLLGESEDTKTVEKLIEGDKNGDEVSLTIEEITPIAPLIPPKGLKEAIEKSGDKKAVYGKSLRKIAPFLDKETLDELVREMGSEDAHELMALAPFLAGGTLAAKLQALHAQGKLEISVLRKCMPFLGMDTIDNLLEGMEITNLDDIMKIAPFLKRSTLKKMVEKCDNGEGVRFNVIKHLAPFLDKDTLSQLLEDTEIDDFQKIAELAPFLHSKTLKDLILKSGVISGNRQKKFEEAELQFQEDWKY